MKRPKRIIQWLQVESRDTEWVDWNKKPAKEYYVKIPLWIVRAYRLQSKLLPVKVIISDEFRTLTAKNRDERRSGAERYFKENWLSKSIKMRKLNNNYIQFLEGDDE